MAIHLDAAGSGPGPDRIDRQVPEARQNRWLLELERAAFASAARPDPGRASRQVAADGGGGDAGQRRPRESVLGPGASSEGAADGAQHAAAETRSAPQPAQTASHRMLHGPAAVQYESCQRSPSAPVGPVPRSAPQGGVALAGLDQVALPVPAAGAARGGFGHALPAFQSQLTLAADLEEAAMAPHNAQHARDAAAEPYAKQVLHVYRGHDGVQASIRDRTLSPAQVRALGAAMAGQLAAAGSVLAALTVNGMRVVSAAPGTRAAGAQDQSTAPAAQQGAPAVRGVSA